MPQGNPETTGFVNSQGTYGGNLVNVNPLTSQVPTIDTLNAGDALLDLTVPTAPVVKKSGFYMMSFPLFVANNVPAGDEYGYQVTGFNAAKGTQGLDFDYHTGGALLLTPGLCVQLNMWLDKGEGPSLLLVNYGTIANQFQVASAIVVLIGG